MKTIFTILVLVVSLSLGASAQEHYKPMPGEHSAISDLSITGTYKIKDDAMTLACTITNNNAEVSYQEVVYQIKFIDKDGKVISTANYTWNDPIVAGSTQKQKKSDYSCPEGSKTLSFCIIDGTKIIDNKKK